MQVNFCPSFILHQRSYRETSLLLDVFTLHHGRVSLVAKGVKGKRRNQQGLLQLYQPLLLSWSGYGDLYSLRDSEADGAAFVLTGESALCGLYINELLVRLLPVGEADKAIFSGYQEVLSRLQDADDNEQSLRLFEKLLLSHLGYGLVLDHDVETGQAIDASQRYYYLPDTGLHLAKETQTENTISGRSLLHLLHEADFDQTSLKEIKQLMRGVIHFYLAGKPLQSRQLFMQLNRYSVNK